MKHLTEQPLNPGFFNSLPGEVCSTPCCKKGQPGAPDSENAGDTRSGKFLTHHGVNWSNRLGARCPLCKCYTKKKLNSGPWLIDSGCKVRTHVCPNPECIDPLTGQRTRLKSVQYDPVSKGVRPSPEDLRFLRKYSA